MNSKPKINPEPADSNINKSDVNKSDVSRPTTPNTNQSLKTVKTNKTFSINLKPIMKYINKNGSLVDTMKDLAAFNEKDLENIIGYVFNWMLLLVFL